MPTSPGQSKERFITLEEDYNASSFSDLKRAPEFSALAKLQKKTRIYTTRFLNLQFLPAPACRSTGRSTDPFHRSTGRSTGCPTESWVLPVGRPGGRPSSNLVHVVHVGRPGRSTEHLLLRAVDRTGRLKTPVLLLFGYFLTAASFVFLSSTSSAITRRSLDDPC